MADRLTDSELNRVVVELERIVRSKEVELERGQVQDILNDLGLPSELLDDALVQLQRQDALSAQTRQRRRIGAAVFVAVMAGLAMTFFWQWRRQQVLSRLSVIQDQVTLADGDPIIQINRQDSPDVFYQVMLENLPVGRRLSLACDWVNPSGQIVRQNNYRAQVIKTSVWRTHCKHRIGATAESGVWTVKIHQGKRSLDSQIFEVA